jgi:predicted DNA-binding transcriptional regulator YafY
MLEDLGIPVTADRGRDGGYRLMPGFKLPPLMLNEEEALALTLGLLAARRLGLVTQAPGVEGALAKVERVLPDRIREQVRAVEETIVWDIGGRRATGSDSAVILTLSTAARERRRVSLGYRKDDGEESERFFDPYGLACRRGRWYATGYCHLRNDLRLFRLDRVTEVEMRDEAFERPANFDVLGAILKSLGSIPREHAVEVVLETSLDRARWHISAEIATLEEVEGKILLRGYTDKPEFLAYLLAGIGCRIEIRQPVELREALRRHAEQMLECVREGALTP